MLIMSGFSTRLTGLPASKTILGIIDQPILRRRWVGVQGRKTTMDGVPVQTRPCEHLSEDGKLSCGYSSFRGKRASMEDFFDVKMSKMNGKTVCLFGIFDGHGGSRAAEYLKQRLFENLLKHPQFMGDTKVARTYNCLFYLASASFRF
ncbi:hypothetical protein BVRB_3g052350 [Beta vulgaris subsp. vulgaris]|nr:hypothetical protein BVRB_3g052350 [Beta vulgaris subsp. vulgaris]